MITVTGTATRPGNVTLRHVVTFSDGSSVIYSEVMQMPEVGQVFDDLVEAMGFIEGKEPK
ncbi:MAG: hypothetical protein WCS30_12000 [Selenomonadaceae bacterium]